MLRRTEVHRVLWKIKEFVYFFGSVQPITLRTLSSNELYRLPSLFDTFLRNLHPRRYNLHCVNTLVLKFLILSFSHLHVYIFWPTNNPNNKQQEDKYWRFFCKVIFFLKWIIVKGLCSLPQLLFHQQFLHPSLPGAVVLLWNIIVLCYFKCLGIL